MAKVVTAAEAVELVKDGMRLGVQGIICTSVPEALVQALGDRYRETDSPKNIKLFSESGIGDAAEGGLNALAQDGLLGELYTAHMGTVPKLQKMVKENKFPAYIVPQGVNAQLVRAIAGKKPGVITHVGVKTYADPREEGCKGNQAAIDAGREVVELMELDGKEYLRYLPFDIDICFIRGTSADELGNLSIEKESIQFDQFELATAVHNCGGIVIAQVEKVVEHGNLKPHEVVIPGTLIDYVVVSDEKHHSEFYSQDLSIKYKSSKYLKFRRGEYQSKICPYGYRKGANGRMEPDEEAASNVRLIFSLAQEGRTSGEIVRTLFERGVPTPAEYKAAQGFNTHDTSRCCHIWSKSTVLRILADERYTGTYIMGKREVTEVGSGRVRMKDESSWIKIPGHHPPIVSREVFEQVRTRLRHVQYPQRGVHSYPLREKVFCGCCRHAMEPRQPKQRIFVCVHTRADDSAPCHGLKVSEAELESMIYEILSTQARITLNVDNLSSAGQLDVQLANQAESADKVEDCLERKRVLYERFVLRQIALDEYKAGKSVLDAELDRLKQIHAAVTAQTERMKADETTKRARTDLAREITETNGLTAELVDALIDRVYFYPENQVEIIWKVKDFCGGTS